MTRLASLAPLVLVAFACNGSVTDHAETSEAGGSDGACRDYVTADGYTCCCGRSTCSLTPGCSHVDDGDRTPPAFGGVGNLGGFSTGSGGRRIPGYGGALNPGTGGTTGSGGTEADASVVSDAGRDAAKDPDSSASDGGRDADAHGDGGSAAVPPDTGVAPPDATD